MIRSILFTVLFLRVTYLTAYVRQSPPLGRVAPLGLEDGRSGE